MSEMPCHGHPLLKESFPSGISTILIDLDESPMSEREYTVATNVITPGWPAGYGPFDRAYVIRES
jgi:hypothetical protein